MFENKNKAPLIKSQLSANIEAEQWTKKHARRVQDQDGLIWSLQFYLRQKANPLDTKSVLWIATMHLKSEMDAVHLLTAKILEEVVDKRLLMLLGTSKIPLAIKARSYSAGKQESAIYELEENIESYLGLVENGQLRDFKRSATCRFIDQILEFDQPFFPNLGL